MTLDCRGHVDLDLDLDPPHRRYGEETGEEARDTIREDAALDAGVELGLEAGVSWDPDVCTSCAAEEQLTPSTSTLETSLEAVILQPNQSAMSYLLVVVLLLLLVLFTFLVLVLVRLLLLVLLVLPSWTTPTHSPIASIAKAIYTARPGSTAGPYTLSLNRFTQRNVIAGALVMLEEST